ncbi:uncharacterized protein [Bemisia tabaci]|uniref:uncharacterized protein n=1 Tax=Bemisia tabaci TaxID=7038 RepID=UPI003B27F019
MIKKLVPCAALLLYSRGFCIFGNPFADWLVKNSETKGPFLASLLFSAAALIFTHRFFIPSRNIRPLPYFLGTFFDFWFSLVVLEISYALIWRPIELFILLHLPYLVHDFFKSLAS